MKVPDALWIDDELARVIENMEDGEVDWLVISFRCLTVEEEEEIIEAQIPLDTDSPPDTWFLN